MTCDTFASLARSRITIQKPNDVSDGLGGFTRTWSDVGIYWAMVVPVSGSQYFAQQAIQVGVTHKMTIRYQDALRDITVVSPYRVLLDGRLYAIKFVRNLYMDMKSYGKDFQEFMTEENAADVV